MVDEKVVREAAASLSAFWIYVTGMMLEQSLKEGEKLEMAFIIRSADGSGRLNGSWDPKDFLEDLRIVNQHIAMQAEK